MVPFQGHDRRTPPSLVVRSLAALKDCNSSMLVCGIGKHTNIRLEKWILIFVVNSIISRRNFLCLTNYLQKIIQSMWLKVKSLRACLAAVIASSMAETYCLTPGLLWKFSESSTPSSASTIFHFYFSTFFFNESLTPISYLRLCNCRLRLKAYYLSEKFSSTFSTFTSHWCRLATLQCYYYMLQRGWKKYI